MSDVFTDHAISVRVHRALRKMLREVHELTFITVFKGHVSNRVEGYAVVPPLLGENSSNDEDVDVISQESFCYRVIRVEPKKS